MSKVRIDLITHDPPSDEYALYIVEDGPWIDGDLPHRMQMIQDRLHDVIKVLLAGVVAKNLPESRGKDFRIQIDCHGAPKVVEEFIRHLASSMGESNEHQSEIEKSDYVNALRIVSRSQMGRGGGDERSDSSLWRD